MGTCPTVLHNLLKLDLACGLSAQTAESLVNGKPCPPEADARLYARFVLRDTFLKKFGEDANAAEADKKALALFLHWNQRCKDWVVPVPTSEIDAIILGEIRNKFAMCFELPDGDVIDFPSVTGEFLNTGPGAAVGTFGSNDYYSKVAATDLTCTNEELYWHYFESALPFALETETELLRSQAFKTLVVKGSNLGFAVKNREISRTTCAEPSLNMMYQLATGKVLEGVLRDRFRIDLSTQPQLNQELARRGSISGKVGTTDQSSASDAIALKLWDWLQPYPEVKDWFAMIRSPATKLPGKSGSYEELHMLSSMGNGFTFPLMSLIYACVIEAVYDVLGIELIRNHISSDNSTLLPGNFAVFGDDLIVVTEAFATLNRVLELLGFAVNHAKSFGEGPFRESCGTDWYFGRNVRGVYCKKLRAPHSRYALINRLNAWSAEWDIPLGLSVGLLKSTVWWIPVPPWENAFAGIMVPLHMVHEVKVHRDPVNDKKPFYQGSIVYAGLRPVPNQWDPIKGKPQCKEHGSHFLNGPGVILAAVRGRIRNGLITVRDDNIKYVKRICIAPGWGFTGASQAGFSPEGWARFEGRLASANLG